MKGSKNFPKVSPKEFSTARNTVIIVKRKSKMKPIKYKHINKGLDDKKN